MYFSLLLQHNTLFCMTLSLLFYIPNTAYISTGKFKLCLKPFLIYMYIYIYTHRYIHIHVYIYIRTHTHTYIYMKEWGSGVWQRMALQLRQYRAEEGCHVFDYLRNHVFLLLLLYYNRWWPAKEMIIRRLFPSGNRESKLKSTELETISSSRDWQRTWLSAWRTHWAMNLRCLRQGLTT